MGDLLSLPWLIRCVLTWAAMLAASACCFLVRSTKPGLQRFLAVLPALAVMHICPLLFSYELEPLSAMSSAFLCVRLTSGKVCYGWCCSRAVWLPLVLPQPVVICLNCLVMQVAAFILGRGALTLPLTLFQFTAVMLAPFMPAEIAADKVVTTPSVAHPGSGGVSPFKLAGELATCSSCSNMSSM